MRQLATKGVSYALLFFILSVSVFATYSKTGGNASNYNVDGVEWTPGAHLDYSTALTSPEQPPLSFDLDGDGTDEIIVLANGAITLYHFSGGLSTLTGINIPGFIAGDSIGQISVEQINVTGRSYIIVPQLTRQAIYGFSYNGTALKKEMNHTPKMEGVGSALWSTTSCDEVGGKRYCLIALSDESGGTATVRYSSFNASGIIANLTSQSTAGGNTDYCFSTLPSMPHQVFPYDGAMKFVNSYMAVNTVAATADVVMVDWITMASDGTISKDGTASVQDTFNHLTGAGICTGFYGSATKTAGSLFTAPQFVETALDTNPEVVVAYQTGATSYQIESFTSQTRLHLSQYPFASDAEGQIVSGIMKASIDPANPTNKDFCVLGYRNTTHNELLCGIPNSPFLGGLLNNIEFYWLGATYLPNSSITKPHFISHMGQFYEEDDNAPVGPGTADLSELITPFGIFSLNYTDTFYIDGNAAHTCSLLGFCILDQRYVMPFRDGATIASDVANNGGADLISITSQGTDSALHYIDDGLVNTDCSGEYCLLNVTWNPCYTSAFRSNTTIGVSVATGDAEGDLMQARVTLYTGTSNEYTSGWSANITAGTVIPFTFTNGANVTTTSAGALIEVRETRSPSFTDSATYQFSVTPAGALYGSSTCTDVVAFNTTSILSTPAGSSATGALLDPVDTLDDAGALFGVTGVVVFWAFILTLLVMTAFWLKGAGAMAVIIAIVSEMVVGIFIGVGIGIIGVGSIITLIILALLLVVISLVFLRQGG